MTHRNVLCALLGHQWLIHMFGFVRTCARCKTRQARETLREPFEGGDAS